jgi:hypothetical protein
MVKAAFPAAGDEETVSAAEETPAVCSEDRDDVV